MLTPQLCDILMRTGRCKSRMISTGFERSLVWLRSSARSKTYLMLEFARAKSLIPKKRIMGRDTKADGL